MTTEGRSYAELHLHLGGAVLPRILYAHLERNRDIKENPVIRARALEVLRKFPSYEKFERRLERKCDSLPKYLEAHKLIEPIQTLDALPYFINRMLRGAYVFEQISYLELRYNPYFRLPKNLPESQVEEKLEEVVVTIATAAAACHREFPIQFTQILCMDTRLPKRINQMILDTALRQTTEVAAIDIAGPSAGFWDQEDDLLDLLRRAKDAGMKITVHAYETESGCFRSVLEYADRIGHGIQIPLREPALLNHLARRGVCLEICPTSYFRTGTLRTYNELKPIFSACFDLGVDFAICTDNSALHGVRLPLEFERLLIHGVLSFPQIERIRENAFRHAFRYVVQ